MSQYYRMSLKEISSELVTLNETFRSSAADGKIIYSTIFVSLSIVKKLKFSHKTKIDMIKLSEMNENVMKFGLMNFKTKILSRGEKKMCTK